MRLIHWARMTGYLDRFDDQFSLFDTPLHYNFKAASDGGESYDLRTVFDGSYAILFSSFLNCILNLQYAFRLVQARPTDAVTLVDNHDTQPGEALESSIDRHFVAAIQLVGTDKSVHYLVASQ